MKTTLIFLAGGTGQRMNRQIPKQFLPLNGKPIALYSLEVFAQLEEIEEIIVVCPPTYNALFSAFTDRFALPGGRRQDSVYNGLEKVSSQAEWICIHDSARPFITLDLVRSLFRERRDADALSLAMPVKNTLKEINAHNEVYKTLDRSKIWEIQTPQLLKKRVLEAGFAHAHAHALSVTDDVSLAELIGHPVRLVTGVYENIKITTPEDLVFAECLLNTK